MRFSRFMPIALAVTAALPKMASAQVPVKYIDTKFATGTTTTVGQFGVGTAQVGPYQAQFTAPGSSPFDIFCIDWDNNFNLNTTFNARILTFAEAVSTTSTFNGVSNFTALKRVLGTQGQYFGSIPNSSSDYYDRLAVESVLAGSFGASPNTDWDEIHYAMWGVFNRDFILLPDFSSAPIGHLNNAVNTALFNPYDASSWRIILDESAWDAQAHDTYQQGAIMQVSTTVPEPGTYALVGAGLLGLLGVARRRTRLHS